jgi:hypothetical protein
LFTALISTANSPAGDEASAEPKPVMLRIVMGKRFQRKAVKSSEKRGWEEWEEWEGWE